MPFLWMGISKSGEAVSYLSGSDSDLVPVSVSFMGENHLVVEESGGGLRLDLKGEDEEEVVGSPPDRVTFEIYEYFANRTSPTLRKQRKKRDGKRRRWEAEHFVRIGDYCPTPTRPLQGLWKVIGYLFHFWCCVIHWEVMILCVIASSNEICRLDRGEKFCR